MCVTHAQYFGKPILCDAGHASSGVDEDVLSKLFQVMSVLYTHSSRRLLLDVCNVSAASKLQRPVQQRLGGGGQECVQLLFTYSLYILTYLFTFVPLPTLLTLSNTGMCTPPITSGFPLSSLLLPAFSISQGENLSIHIVGFWGEMGRLEPD